MASGLECKGDPLAYSSSRVALVKIGIAKKTCSLQGNIKNLPVDIIWSATQSDQLLQQLTSTGFCVKSALRERSHLTYPNVSLFFYI